MSPAASATLSRPRRRQRATVVPSTRSRDGSRLRRVLWMFGARPADPVVLARGQNRRPSIA